jgi:AIG2-like family
VAERQVAVFFYGSYMNRDVLKEAHLVSTEVEVARLDGFEILINPLANLVPAPQGVVYGILTHAAHPELERLYAHAEHVLGGVYLPEAVLVHVHTGQVPALCYIAPHMEPAAPDPAYVERIVAPAREYGFPEPYIAKLESFRP